MKKLIIFDLDGVLIDTKDIHYQALNEALEHVGPEYVISQSEHISLYDGLSTNEKLCILSDKKFLYEEVKIDSSSDYVDIYLQSIKVSSNKYEIVDDGTNIVVTFNQALVAEPSSLVASDFLVKGKIVSR